MKNSILISVKYSCSQKFNKGSFCLQLKTHFVSESVRFLSFLFLCLFTIPNIQAQDMASLDFTQDEIIAIQENQIANAITIDEYTIKGTVLDEENLPLYGASVVLKGTAEGITTDIDGKFEFPRALAAGEVLLFKYLGYETKEYIVVESASEVIDITITFDASDIELMGEVAVDGVYTTKRNIFQKFIALFK